MIKSILTNVFVIRAQIPMIAALVSGTSYPKRQEPRLSTLPSPILTPIVKC